MVYLNKFKAAVIVEDDFEEADLTAPKDALKQACIKPLIILPQKESVTGSKDESRALNCRRI